VSLPTVAIKLGPHILVQNLHNFLQNEAEGADETSMSIKKEYIIQGLQSLITYLNKLRTYLGM
jgi:hypothetical protein